MLQSDKESIRPIDGGVTAPLGFRAAGVHAGLKRKNKDLALLVSDEPSVVAGTFTANKVKAAPLLVSMEHMANGFARGVVINSGNANACTGDQGLADARAMAACLAEKLDVPTEDILVASTGVIGSLLPMDTVTAGIEDAWQQLDQAGGHEAAEAIMTTDTRPKSLAVQFELQGRTVTLGGMAKGSGMIHPNMATMLAFLTTDAAVDPTYLHVALKRVVDRTFNMISVDGDTSTNDMTLLMANGMAQNEPLHEEDPDAALFEAALHTVCLHLAKEIAADGEGATKLIEIHVKGAPTLADARRVARSISTSNLVKTAMFGEDANWGRILCAAGYAGAELDPDKVTIDLADLTVTRDGVPVPFDEDRAKEVLQEDEVTITLDMGLGSYEATAWTCDMTYDYIKINASYRT